MGKVARISLSTSKLRLGGGRFGRVARQAVRERADVRRTNRVLLEALNRAGLSDVPEDRHEFTAFFVGPLLDVIGEQLGEGARDAIRAEVEEALQPVATLDSGLRSRDEPTVLLRLVLVGVAPEAADAVEAEAGDHEVLRVHDVLEVLGTCTERAPMRVVLDASVELIPAGLRMLSKVLPQGTPVLQWGGPVIIERPAALRLERLAADASPAEVARRCLRGDGLEPDAGVVPDADEAAAQPPALPAATLLIADDDPAWRAALARSLTAEGYDIVAAADGAAALEGCLDHEPALVLSDFEMPELGGGQLAALLLQRLGSAAPPVLLVTSSDVDARDLPGVLAVIRKSEDLGVLLRRVRRLLERRRRAT